MESGTKLAHYENSTLLGKGGMGEVWRGTDANLNRQVAIKRIAKRPLLLAVIWFCACSTVWSQSLSSFTLPDGGAFVRTTSGQPDPTNTGYATVESNTGNSVLAGLAIFGLRQKGVLVSEAAVSATQTITRGRIFAETNGPVRTAIAIANPNDAPATISFFFSDNANASFAEGTTIIPANGQIARFMDEAPFSGGSALLGTFSFSSSRPVAAVAIRSFVNQRGESLVTTLSVADLDSPPTSNIVFPHFADGGGWTTELMLVNPTEFTLNGLIEFSNRVTVSELPSSISSGFQFNTFNYSIPPSVGRHN